MVTRRQPETLQGRPEWIGGVWRLAMVMVFLEGYPSVSASERMLCRKVIDLSH